MLQSQMKKVAKAVSVLSGINHPCSMILMLKAYLRQLAKSEGGGPIARIASDVLGSVSPSRGVGYLTTLSFARLHL